MNIFEILGLPTGTPKEVLEQKYNEIKADLSEKRFLPGDAGNDAAKKLTALERAWNDYISFSESDNVQFGVGDNFSYVEELLKRGDVTEAQNVLDSIKERNAEWHYYQARVYYQRDWLSESRKHLKIAVDMEPGNSKYKTALDKLDLKMGNDKVPPRDFASAQQATQDNMCGNMLANCCLAYCCSECCYSLLCCR